MQGKHKLDFIVGGAQKSGTTALFRYLRHHPQIGIGRTKELHFFDKDRFFATEPVNYRKLHSAFKDDALHRLAGDFTPIYLYWPAAAQRIYDYNPAMKLIFILRDPVERAYSQWVMESEKGKERKTFADAVRNEVSNPDAPPHAVQSYLARGRYSEQLSRYYRLFPDENILVVQRGDLMDDHPAVLDTIYRFLDIEPVEAPAHTIVHSRSYPPMSPPMEAYLRMYFRKRSAKRASASRARRAQLVMPGSNCG